MQTSCGRPRVFAGLLDARAGWLKKKINADVCPWGLQLPGGMVLFSKEKSVSGSWRFRETIGNHFLWPPALQKGESVLFGDFAWLLGL